MRLLEAEIKDRGRAKKPPEFRAKLLKRYLNLLFFPISYFSFLYGGDEGKMEMEDWKLKLMALRLTLVGDVPRKSGVKHIAALSFLRTHNT